MSKPLGIVNLVGIVTAELVATEHMLFFEG